MANLLNKRQKSWLAIRVGLRDRLRGRTCKVTSYVKQRNNAPKRDLKDDFQDVRWQWVCPARLCWAELIHPRKSIQGPPG